MSHHKSKYFTNNYVSIKTAGQLVLDLGSTTAHISALVHLIRLADGDYYKWEVQLLWWFLVGTILFQITVAIGLFIFRSLTLDVNETYIRHRTAKIWNYIFFVALALIACLETFIGVYEKFGLPQEQLHRAQFLKAGGNCSLPPH